MTTTTTTTDHHLRPTWLELPHDHPFGVQTLPYGVFETRDDATSRIGVRIGDFVLDLTTASETLLPGRAHLFGAGTLNPLMTTGADIWAEVRRSVETWLTDCRHRDDVEPHLVPVADAQMRLPFTVADYVDFYASEHHATNIGRMFRPDQAALTPNWKHLPIGYHGRAGTVVVSDTPVVRPRGQQRTADGTVVFGPSKRLDIEAEVGFVVGKPSTPAHPVPLEDFEKHVFGVCLVNDWSARDIQAWEYVPLGPFLGKSFATSIAPWVVPLAALQSARVSPPPRDPRPLEYLDDTRSAPWGLEVRLEVALNGHVISRPPFASMYWTAAQQLAHMTVNGASLRTGDLFASGTISGPGRDERGSLIELSWGGAEPISLPDQSTRTFLEDGDEIVITATAPGPDGSTIGFGEVRGIIEPC
jgi:fumarylacetoacetase